MTETLTLSQLQLLIRDTIYLSLPQTFWVTAEISEISINTSGHCYLELVEKHDDDKNIRARIRGIVWNSRFGFIRSFFENITGESLKPGMKILVKARAEYHEIYGLSIVINDIDPAFTLGEMALKRQQIIKKLEEEGVFSMNKDLEFPVLPQRIAIISSKNAAGYTDFINQLAGNSYGYVFYTALIDTPMQGTETEQGVISSLDRVAENAELFDLVVIIRGGGSQTDLSWFDNYGIAYHITQFPLPVVTGIGHEKNMSVTDMVANKSLKTPTAVANYIVECMATAENRLTDICVAIRDVTGDIIDENRVWLDSFSVRLLPLSRILLTENREKLSGRILELSSLWRREAYRHEILISGLQVKIRASADKSLSDKLKTTETFMKNLHTETRNYLNKCKTGVVNLEGNLSMLDPGNVLRRGYTITSKNGKIIRSREQLSDGDEIDTLFIDGKVRSGITSTGENT